MEDIFNILITNLNHKMKKITLSLLFGFMSIIGFSQVGLVENFDSGFTLPTGWTSDLEDYTISFFENCDGNSIRANLSIDNLDAQLTSPNVAGQSNGTDLTIAFDYKIVDWPDVVNGTVPGWGEILIEYSTNDGGTWTTVETINDINHSTTDICTGWSVIVPAASLPVGSDFKFRLNANWSSGSYFIYLDNISATQVVEDPPSCVSLITPSGSTAVSINTDLEWSTATGIPAGYTVTVGTTPGGTEIADNVNVGLSTTYDLPDLEYATTYYVSIIPFNSNGDAIGCTENIFTTGSDPNAPVDCSSGAPINTVYCYTINETMTWSFESSDGAPLNVFFNAGIMEACCDEVTIYDGTDNTGTVLYDDNNGGDMAGVSVIAPSGFVFIEIDSDSSISCESNNYVPLDFDISCVDTTAIPNCNASLIAPANGEVDVNSNADLVWSPASIIVTGYVLSVGTTPGGTELIDNLDVGLVTSYTPGGLLYETVYYVTIVPYNDNGSAINCNEESFTTESDPYQVVDCSINEIINTTYCYDNGTNGVFVEIFNFQSSDGAPLSIVFNSGDIEDFWDTIRITDADDSVIYEGDNGGDLTGLNFVTIGDALTIFVESDGSGSCTSSGYIPWDFDVTCVDTSAVPNCNASLNSPANGAIDVSENEDLVWNAATVFVTGYYLSIGTSPGAVDILDNLDVGNVLTYEPGILNYETTYYVTIVPYNDNGFATGCTEESYTTRSDPNQIVDCPSSQVINTLFCYENNSGGNGNGNYLEIFSFQSSNGNPLSMIFNAGTIETCCDTLRIEEGDGTLIYQGTGGAGGVLAGLSFFSTTDRIVVFYESDGSVSCSSGSDDEWDFDVTCFDPLAPPVCNAEITTPVNGETDVAINTNITWSPATIVVTGYVISIGSTPGGTDVADNVDVGNVLNYNPGVLDNATEHYVTIVPYNDNGPAIGCVEQSFKTICIPQEVTFNAIGDCDTDPNNPDFILEVNITDFSGSTSILISDDQGSPVQTATETGIITMGPYAANTIVIITTIKSDDDTCDVISSPITFICPPPPNPCSIIYAGEDATVDCADTSTDLAANFHLFGQDTNTYVINGLDTCPLPTTIGGTPTSLDIDDTWSEALDIGFQFCFFGNIYSQILVGSNGVLSFELENAGGYNDWGFTDSLPNNTDNALAQGNIFGVGHDINPAVSGDINYLVIGTAPYRMFVVNYTDVAQFSCTDLISSSQIILYESSNNIDVNVFDKPTCTGWNSGNAVIGVQNVAGTVAFTPVDRNTGPWTASNESYRFAPSAGIPNYTFEWFDGATSLGNIENVTVTPTETTTYTATVTYELCTGGTSTLTDEVTITVDPSGLEDATFTMSATCDGGTANVTGTLGGTFAFEDPTPTDGAVIDPATGTVTNGVSETTYTVEYTTPATGACAATSTVDVTVTLGEDAGFTMTATCDGGIANITGDTGGTFAFQAPAPTDGAVIDAATGTVTGGGSETVYTIEYTTGGICPQTSAQTITTLLTSDTSFTMTASCDGGTADITGDLGGTFTFNPTPTDGAMIDMVTGEVSGGTAGATYTVEYAISDACSVPNAQNLTLLIDVFDYVILPDCNGAIYELTVGPINDGYDANTATYELYDDMNSLLHTNAVGDNVIVIDESLFTPPMSGSTYNYVVKVTDASGCVATNEVLVESINCIISQGISPNNDGKNDAFDLRGYDVSRLEIFNRHGMKVYSKTNYTNEWYGQSDGGDELPVGTYFYKMEYQGNKTRTSWIYINREN